MTATITMSPVSLVTSSGAAATVLVVDDEPIVVEVVSRYLQRAGFHVVTASNGDRAIEAALTGRPALIVLDVMLPGIDGVEVCRRLREDHGVRAPIILLTARGEEADRIAGLRTGADDYVVKPFSFTVLVSRLPSPRAHAAQQLTRSRTDRRR